MIFVAALLIFLVSILVISYPLVAKQLERFEDIETEDEEYSERDALLEALSDLELSFETGKVSESAYQNQKLQLQKQYLKVVEGGSSQ